MITNHKFYEAMQDSGVAWLGEVPTHWDVRRLKYISRFLYGDSLAGSIREIGQVPVYGSNGPIGSHIVANTHSPCIIVGRKGSFGKVNFCDNPVFAIDTTFFVDDRATSENIRWLFYALGWLRLDAVSKDSAVPGLNREDAYKQLVPTPPLPEQAAIVRYLDYVDRRVQRLIRAKLKLVALLTEQKQVIIHRAVTRGLDPNAPMKDSGVEWLREVPAHWEVTRLKFHLTQNNSGIWGENFSDDGTTVLRSTEQTVSGEWRIRDPARIHLPSNDVASALLDTGDLVVTKSSGSQRHIGKTSWVTPDIADMKCCFSNFMQRLRVDRDTNSKYIWRSINSSVGREQFVYHSTSTTGLGNLNGTILANCWFAFPPYSEQTAIANYLDQATTKIDTTIARTKRQIELLTEYRTRLISDVVTGKLDVREAAAALPETDPLAAEDTPTAPPKAAA